jgi:hypothetical protein
MLKVNHIKKFKIILSSIVFCVTGKGAAPSSRTAKPSPMVSPEKVPVGTLFGKKVYFFKGENSHESEPITRDDWERFWREKCELYTAESRVEEFKRGFDQIWDNPIGRRLIEEIERFLLMSYFRDVKIAFCYDLRDDTRLLGPLNDLKTEGCPRAKFRKNNSPRVADEAIKYGFHLMGAFSEARDTFIEENLDTRRSSSAINTVVGNADFIPADGSSPHPVDKFVISIPFHGPFDQRHVQTLEAINPNGMLRIGHKWLSLDEWLFHELNHVREFLMYIYSSMTQPSNTHPAWSLYGGKLLCAAEIVLAEKSLDVGDQEKFLESLKAKERERILSTQGMSDVDLDRLKQEALAYKERFECPLLIELESAYAHKPKKDLVLHKPQMGLVDLFSCRDMELHCMTGLLRIDDDIYWDPINEANYVHKKAEMQDKAFYPRLAHKCWGPKEMFLLGDFRLHNLCEFWIFLRAAMSL